MGWFPGAQRDPATRANTTGNAKQNMRLHYTVGTDSRALIRNKNLAHFLIAADGTVIQFGPTEAIFYDACEWNVTGWGIELESLNGSLTDAQIAACGAVLRWGSEADGIPLIYRDSPDDRLPVGTVYRGVITHRSLHEQKCDEHYDGFAPEVFARMIGTSPATQGDDIMKGMFIRQTGTVPIYLAVGGTKVYCTPDLYNTYAYLGVGIGMVNSDIHDIDAAAFESFVTITSNDSVVKRLAAWIAKLFPAKAARAGQV